MRQPELNRLEEAGRVLERAEAAGLEGEDLERAKRAALDRVGLDDHTLSRIGAALERELARRRRQRREQS